MVAIIGAIAVYVVYVSILFKISPKLLGLLAKWKMNNFLINFISTIFSTIGVILIYTPVFGGIVALDEIFPARCEAVCEELSKPIAMALFFIPFGSGFKLFAYCKQHLLNGASL